MAVNENINSSSAIPGQSARTHSDASCDGPWQSSPPCVGGGFVHVRVRVLVPCPQLTSHLLHWLHSVHTPSTTIYKRHTGRKLTSSLIYHSKYQCLSEISSYVGFCHDKCNKTINIKQRYLEQSIF